MPSRPKSKIHTISDAFRLASEGLRRASKRPNIWGYEPHDKQEPFHQSQARGRLFLGGNRSGKTVGGGTEGVRYALGKHPYRRIPPPPTRGRIVSVDFTYGIEQIVKPEIARWMPLSEIKGGSWESGYNSQTKELTLENGSTIEFMSYEQEVDKFAGTSRHWIWFDEEPPKDIFNECKARLIDTRGDWWITMTPVEGMTWIFDDIYLASKSDPEIEVFTVNMWDNPHISAAEIDSFAATLDEDERKARIEGKFVQIGGLVYAKYFSPKNIIDPIIPPKDWLHVASLDHGLNNPTCWLWAAVNPDGTIIVYDEHYESGQVVSYHANVVHSRNKIHGREPDYYTGDPSIENREPIQGTSVQLEYIEFGIPVMPGTKDKLGTMNRVSRYLRGVGDPPNNIPRLYITRNCVNLIHEIPRLRWARYQTRKVERDHNRQEKVHKKDDHACDALLYIIGSRPPLDDGTDRPVKMIPEGASVAVVGTTRYDEVLKQPEEQWDFYLGSEW